jgi:predicted permease
LQVLTRVSASNPPTPRQHIRSSTHPNAALSQTFLDRVAYPLAMANVLDALRRDLWSSIRLLVSRPGWSAAAILCLAIATGANTAAFTIVNGLLLRPLPFDEPDRLVMVALREQGSTRPFSLREYRELAEHSSATSMLLARTFFPLSLAAGDRDDGARMAQAELVSGNYFETLRVAPFLGRFFDERAGRNGSPLLAVLSHRLWQYRFGSDPGVVGKTVRVNGRSATVAAVTPPGFVGAMQLVAADLWLPSAIYPDLAGSARADTTPMFGVMGRLAADITVEEAESRLTALASTLELKGLSGESLTVIVKPANGFGVPVSVEGMVLTVSGFIYVMMGLLMAVACANVAALVLARGVGRSREIAVRLSLGASRMHIARQLLTESIVLALAGCAAGVVVALWLTQALVARLSTPFQYVSHAIDAHPDARVFAYSAIATAVAAALCGIGAHPTGGPRRRRGRDQAIRRQRPLPKVDAIAQRHGCRAVCRFDHAPRRRRHAGAHLPACAIVAPELRNDGSGRRDPRPGSTAHRPDRGHSHVPDVDWAAVCGVRRHRRHAHTGSAVEKQYDRGCLL